MYACMCVIFFNKGRPTATLYFRWGPRRFSINTAQQCHIQSVQVDPLQRQLLGTEHHRQTRSKRFSRITDKSNTALRSYPTVFRSAPFCLRAHLRWCLKLRFQLAIFLFYTVSYPVCSAGNMTNPLLKWIDRIRYPNISSITATSSDAVESVVVAFRQLFHSETVHFDRLQNSYTK